MNDRLMTIIDGKKLLREIEKRGLSAKEMSLKMGHCDNYITVAAHRNRIAKSAIALLEIIYDIRLDEIAPAYQPEAEPEQLEIPEPPADPIDYERLGQVIYQAVYEAVKKAWAE